MARFIYHENILIASRPGAEVIDQTIPGLSVIAIQDPGSEESKLPNAHRVLRLSFDDIEEFERGTACYGGRYLEPISKMQAQAIAAFVDVTEGPLLVHCDGGVSRSAGVAAAIIEATGGDASGVYREKTPNATCHRAVFEAMTRPVY